MYPSLFLKWMEMTAGLLEPSLSLHLTGPSCGRAHFSWRRGMMCCPPHFHFHASHLRCTTVRCCDLPESVLSMYSTSVILTLWGSTVLHSSIEIYHVKILYVHSRWWVFRQFHMSTRSILKNVMETRFKCQLSAFLFEEVYVSIGHTVWGIQHF